MAALEREVALLFCYSAQCGNSLYSVNIPYRVQTVARYWRHKAQDMQSELHIGNMSCSVTGSSEINVTPFHELIHCYCVS
jgi:hypothetical protein